MKSPSKKTPPSFPPRIIFSNYEGKIFKTITREGEKKMSPGTNIFYELMNKGENVLGFMGIPGSQQGKNPNHLRRLKRGEINFALFKREFGPKFWDTGY